MALSPWAWLGIGAGVGLGAFLVLAVAAYAPSRPSSSTPRESSLFAHAEVKCTGVGDSVHCAVAMQGGKGRVCWDVLLRCDDRELYATDCSDLLESGETASYTIPGFQFTPPLTLDKTCTSTRLANVKMK